MNRASNVSNSAYAAAHERICSDATALLHWVAAQQSTATAQGPVKTSCALLHAKATLQSLASLIFTTDGARSNAAYRFYEQLCIYVPVHQNPGEEFLANYRAWRNSHDNPPPSAAPTISIQALRRVRRFMEAT